MPKCFVKDQLVKMWGNVLETEEYNGMGWAYHGREKFNILPTCCYKSYTHCAAVAAVNNVQLGKWFSSTSGEQLNWETW